MGEEGRVSCSALFLPSRRTCRRKRLSLECEDHGNDCLNLNRLAAEQRWPVAPLADGVKRRTRQNRMAAEQFEGINRAVASDDGAKLHSAFQAGPYGELGIHRQNAVDQQRFL